tara:strand:- start:2088 stop:3800 length:1713 start_codon:yes stop_codon:yes gene_type:complete
MAEWKKVIVSGSSADLSALSLDTSLPVGSGGTGRSTLTAGGVLLGSGTGAVTPLARLAAGQLVIGSTTGDPVNATLSGGSGIAITEGDGTITIAADGLGAGTVTNIATAGTVNGLTLTGGPITTTGTITLGGTLSNIANTALTNSTVSYGGVSVALGAADSTPAFDLSDATDYPTSALVGTITNTQLAGSIANSKLSNSSVSFGGVSVALGAADSTPAFDLSDATDYPTSALVGTITNTQLAGSIANSKLSNSSVSFGGVSVALGAADSTPAFNLSDATAYPGDSSLTTLGTVTAGDVSAILPAGTVSGSAQINGSSITNNSVSFGGVSVSLGGSDATPAFNLSDATGYLTTALSGTITNTQLAGGITNGKLSNSAITIAGTSTSLGGTITLATIVAASGIISGSSIASPGQGEVRLTTNGVVGSTVDLGLQQTDSVTFGALSITNDAIIGGDLTVNGTTTSINTTNLDIEDQYILLNSGSASTLDSGIVFGGSNGVAQSGAATIWDASYNSNDGRLAIVNNMASSATGNQTPSYHIAGVFEGTEVNAATAQVDHPGNIRIESDEIYIYI